MTYQEELEGLGAAYAATTALESSELVRAAQRVRGRALVAVGSGGAFPAARLAARLHTARTGRPAIAVSPLAYVGSSPAAGPTCLLLASATARHPDTALAAAAAAQRGHPVLLVTQRQQHELDGALAAPSVTVLTVPQPAGRDGFLATASLLSTATALVLLYSPPGSGLPATLPSLEAPPGPTALRERLLVLHGPDEQPAADDVEARFAESGLAAVQVADYRTLAHGRHFGLARHLDRTTVIALAGPGSASLADRTLKAMPHAAHVVRISTALAGPTGTLDLLVQAAYLPVDAAREQDVALHRPGVPPFGRRLYHLSHRPAAAAPAVPAPVQRKIDAAGLPPGHPEASAWYADALTRWQRALRKETVGALVLDYDGTVVTTEGRFGLPTAPVRQALLRLLASGLPLAFASGRGDSLHRDLRKWVPQEHWERVVLGLHNGAWQLRLADDADNEPGGDAAVLAEAARRLADHPPGVLAVRRTPTQVSVTSPDALVGPETMRMLVEAALRAGPPLDVRVAGSAHSVDVTAAGGGKEVVVQRMQAAYGAVLAAGDRGDAGGNDFDLLAATRWSFSVDRCSADPGRCWPVDGDATGPDALLRVLDSLRQSRGRHRYLPASRRKPATGTSIR